MPINGFLYPGAKFIPPYEVANSVRYNDDDSPSMYKTPGSSGNRRTWTFSTWFKRGNLGSSQWILDAYGGSSDEFHIYISSGNAIGIYTIGGGFGSNLTISTNNLVRDVSAWYHLVVRCDTTQSTASDRLRIYLNGVEATYGTYNNFTENGEGQVNEASTKHWLGRRNAGDYFDGYMAETVLVDGLSLAPTSFGEFDSASPTVWKPIDVSGLTFGTNGFYLDYEDSSNLGNDANGGTDFTEANLAATDQSTDTCTNNFATLNPLNGSGTRTSNDNYSEGNTIMIPANHDNYTTTLATMGAKQGKWYWEAQSIVEGTASNAYYPRTIGFMRDDYGFDYSTLGQDDKTWDVVYNSGNWDASHNNSIVVNDMSTDRTSGNILNFALDLDNGKFYFGINGTYLNSGNPTSGSSGTGALHTLDATDLSFFIIPAVTSATTGTYYKFNFGNPAFSISSGNADGNGYGNFEYAPPSGYYAWCSKNLAEFG